jgi:integrin alpha 8
MHYAQWNQIMLHIFVTCVWIPSTVLGFNVDTRNINVIPGPKGTLFGFSASFVPGNTAGGALGMIVGAPNAKRAVSRHENASGVIHLCTNVLDKTERCIKEERYETQFTMLINDSEVEKFGSSIAMTNSGQFMVCSPGWMDTETNFHFSPGRCSYTKLDNIATELQPFYQSTSENRQKYYIIKFDDGKNEYYEGLATFGVSTDSDRGTVFVIGAPGVLMSEGTVMILDMNDPNNRSRVSTIVENKLTTTAYGYLGYSVKIGRFCDGSDICFAAGAPNLNRVGMVSIYKWMERKNVTLVDIFQEKQAWCYFGHTLSAVDTDGDGYDELLVGAPHYTITDDKNQGYDQGRVFVYSRSKLSIKFKQTVTLDGSRKKYSRFGSAIQNIGDVNLDKYYDVVVGAPGEDDGAGCIYIYLGGLAGLTSVSQRITAQEVSTGLADQIRGFGFAFSDHATPTNQSYPIFAATSVVSDTVVVFKIRPIVDVLANLTVQPSSIDMEKKSCTENGTSSVCFKINFCMKYQLRGGGDRVLRFQIGLAMDVEMRSNLKRALIRLSNGSFVGSISELQKDFTANAKEDCIDFQVFLLEDQVNQERFKPIEIVGKYTLVEDSTSNFNPLLDATKPNNISAEVTILNKCGDDKVCNVDLSVFAFLGYDHTSNWNSIVVNYTKELQVNITVKNSNETSFWTAVKIEIDFALNFGRSKSDVAVTCQHDRPLLDPANTAAIAAPLQLDKTTVVCNFYKPLNHNGRLDLLVVFETVQMELTKKTLTITVEAFPKNEVHNPEVSKHDNTAIVTTDVDIISKLFIFGTSSPAEDAVFEAKRISVKDTSGHYRKTGNEEKPFNVTHKILIKNEGESFLPKTTISVYVPIFLLDRTELVSKASVKISTPDGSVTICPGTKNFEYLQLTTMGTTQTTTTDRYSSRGSAATGATGSTPDTTATTTVFDFSSVNRRRKRATEDKGDQSTIYTLDCADPQICQVFICDTSSIVPSGSHAEINVTLVIDKANIPMPEGHNAFYYEVQADVNEPTHPLFKDWDENPTVQTVTKFHLVQSGGKVNIWIIIGCVIAGLVLITIIVLVFWKLGFFKRDKHKQVEKWRRESQRRSRKGYSKAPKEDIDMGEVTSANPDSKPDASL